MSLYKHKNMGATWGQPHLNYVQKHAIMSAENRKKASNYDALVNNYLFYRVIFRFWSRNITIGHLNSPYMRILNIY